MRFEGVRQLLDLMPVLVAFLDRVGNVEWANLAFCRMFTIDEQKRGGGCISVLFPGLREDLPALLHDVLETGTAKTGIIETADTPVCGTKSLKIDLLSCTANRLATGQIIFFAVDITEQVEMERLKKEAFDQIEKNIEQFAILGDHIRNPVTVITGLCDILEDRVLAEKIVHQAQEIDRIVDRIDQGWIDSEKVRSIIKKYYDVGVSGTHELVARAIHDEYLIHMKEAGHTPETHPSLRPWNELPRNLQESNLVQADDIWRKLGEIHCAIGIATESRPKPFEFTADEIEVLALHEHERWMNERLRRGWTYGPVVNMQERVHNCLVPWSQLPEDQREKDRNTIRTLPQILAKVRLKIVRFT